MNRRTFLQTTGCALGAAALGISTDAHATWSGVGLGPFHILDLAHNGQTMYATTTTGLVYKSGNGTSWSPIVPTGIPSGQKITQVAAGGSNLIGCTTEGKVYRRDGDTWTVKRNVKTPANTHSNRAQRQLVANALGDWGLGCGMRYNDPHNQTATVNMNNKFKSVSHKDFSAFGAHLTRLYFAFATSTNASLDMRNWQGPKVYGLKRKSGSYVYDKTLLNVNNSGDPGSPPLVALQSNGPFLWAASAKGRIYRLVGNTFQPKGSRFTANTALIESIAAKGTSKIVIQLRNGRCYKSSNGGSSWNSYKLSGRTYNKVVLFKGQIYAGTSKGIVRSSL